MSLDKDYLKDLFTDEVKGCLKSDGDPVGTAANAVSEHNTSEDAHSDIRGLIDLDYNELRSHAASDKHITPAERIRWNAKSDFSGSYNDLSDKPTIPTVPTQVSAFNNDAGYLTQHQDISGKANSSDLTAHTGNSTVHITAAERTKWNQAVTDVGNLSEEIDDYKTLTLGTHSDGKIYLFKNGSPIGTGVEAGVSGDVVGYVDSDNNIIVSGTLAKGTYTVKYEMEDGSTVDIGKLVLEEPAEVSPNLVVTSVGSDGQIYNGAGYRDGYYASSSGMSDSSDSACVVTGLIPNVLKSTSDSIYVKGATLDISQSHVRFAGFTNASTILGAIYNASNWTNRFNIETLGDNYYKLTPTDNFVSSGYANCEYFRMSLVGTGENLVISKNPIE